MLPSDFLKGKEYNIDDPQYFDTSEKILGLSDALAEEIILDNITEQLSGNLDILNPRINYVSLFKEKYSALTPDDDEYDEEYIKDAVNRVVTTVGDCIRERYDVEIGDDSDLTSLTEKLKDMETLYEFLFVRQGENITDYLNREIFKNRENFIKSYSNLMDDEKYNKDIFILQSKKKFKNTDDVVIIHFLNEIIYEIKGQTTSAYDLFMKIADADKYEEYNNRMLELLINYGTKIVLKDDQKAAEKYLEPLEDPVSFGEIRNNILIKYLQGCKTDD